MLCAEVSSADQILRTPPDIRSTRRSIAAKHHCHTPRSDCTRCSAQLATCAWLAQWGLEYLEEDGVVHDERKPDVVRIAPTSLYNLFMNACQFCRVFRRTCEVVMHQGAGILMAASKSIITCLIYFSSSFASSRQLLTRKQSLAVSSKALRRISAQSLRLPKKCLDLLRVIEPRLAAMSLVVQEVDLVSDVWQ